MEHYAMYIMIATPIYTIYIYNFHIYICIKQNVSGGKNRTCVSRPKMQINLLSPSQYLHCRMLIHFSY